MAGTPRHILPAGEEGTNRLQDSKQWFLPEKEVNVRIDVVIGLALESGVVINSVFVRCG